MSGMETTSWELIDGAARGNQSDRDEFARRYEGPIRAYLTTRWRSSILFSAVDDAAQEVFVECFRQNGVLAKAEPTFASGFRPFLYGAVRNIARRFEVERMTDLERRQGLEGGLPNVVSDDSSLSQVFDRAWAISIMQEAVLRHRLAAQGDPEALRRVELLRLKFQENQPIRAIAELWEADPAKLHREYAKARLEFKAALQEVVAWHKPGTDAEIQHECALLLAHLT